MTESRATASQKLLIVIPTYNERENLRLVVDAIWKSLANADILIVDDNSPDGTGEIAEEMSKESGGRLRVLHRRGKAGLGRAYIHAFQSVRGEDYDFIIQMDADLSHEPRYISEMLATAADADVVVGSRYLRGVNVVNWDFKRLLLSKVATLYVNVLTGLPVSDATSGFKCWRAEALRQLELDRVNASGYLFQIEMNLLAVRSNLRLKESSIIFYERERGRSKIDWRIIREAILGTMRLAVRHRFHNWFVERTPVVQPAASSATTTGPTRHG
jgi:dolichol-phosphate mannosyltransferase